MSTSETPLGDFEDAYRAAGLVTVTQYANLKGVSRQTVLWYIKKGKVKAQKFGSIWLITPSE